MLGHPDYSWGVLLLPFPRHFSFFFETNVATKSIDITPERSRSSLLSNNAASTEISLGSRRIYVKGTRGLQVPMREILQEESSLPNGKKEPNPPIFVYDTSGDWGDPLKHPKIEEGLPALRSPWIASRFDTETRSEMTSAYARERTKDASLDSIRFKKKRPILKGFGSAVTQLHYAKAGIITQEMEFAAIRENNNRRAYVESLSELSPKPRISLATAPWDGEKF